MCILVILVNDVTDFTGILKLMCELCFTGKKIERYCLCEECFFLFTCKVIPVILGEFTVYCVKGYSSVSGRFDSC